jgi:hypothetical protein
MVSILILPNMKEVTNIEHIDVYKIVHVCKHKLVTTGELLYGFLEHFVK